MDPILEKLGKIEERLERGDARMGELSERMTRLELQVAGTAADIAALSGRLFGIGNEPGLLGRVDRVEQNCIRSAEWRQGHDASETKRSAEDRRGKYAVVVALIAMASSLLTGALMLWK